MPGERAFIRLYRRHDGGLLCDSSAYKWEGMGTIDQDRTVSKDLKRVSEDRPGVILPFINRRISKEKIRDDDRYSAVPCQRAM